MKQISQNKEIGMDSKHFLKVLLTLAIIEIQIKTIVRFSLTPIRMVIIKLSNDNEYWHEYREKIPLIHCWREYKLV